MLELSDRESQEWISFCFCALMMKTQISLCSDSAHGTEPATRHGFALGAVPCLGSLLFYPNPF